MKRFARAYDAFLETITDLSPETIALCVAAGLVCGVFPMWGIPTLLCLAAALLPRMNVAALLAVNHLTSPLQYALFLPFSRAGVWMFGARGPLLLHAIEGWCLIVPLGIPLYFALACVLRRRATGQRALWRLRAGGNIGSAERLASQRILSSNPGIS